MKEPVLCLRSGCTTRAVRDGLCNYHFKKVQPPECQLYKCSAHGHAKECPEFAAQLETEVSSGITEPPSESVEVSGRNARLGALVRSRIEHLANELDEGWKSIWLSEAKAVEQVIREFPFIGTWVATAHRKPTETRTGELAAVFAETPKFSYVCVPDEPQDVAKHPERFPYWLPLPKTPSVPSGNDTGGPPVSPNPDSLP